MIDPVSHGSQEAKVEENDGVDCVAACRLLRNSPDSNACIMRIRLRTYSGGDLQPLDLSTQKRDLLKIAQPDRTLVRRAQRSARTNWLLQMVCTNRPLARQARRYIIEKDPGEYPKYLQVLKLIRRAEVFSARTNVTNLRTAFLKACAVVDI